MFDNSVEFHNFTLSLKEAGVSYKTKIIKMKRAGKKIRNFVVLLVEDTPRAFRD